MMIKHIIFALAILSCFITKAQKYKLNIVNSSKNTLSFRLNNGPIKSIGPAQNISAMDSVLALKPGTTFSLSEMEIIPEKESHGNKSQISFVIIENSVVNINISEPDKNTNLHRYTITGLPFNDEQTKLIEIYFPRKKRQLEFERNQSSKKRDRSFSQSQRDSIQNETLSQRIKYLKFVDSFITSVKHSDLSYHLFKSELLYPQNVLTIGKQQVLSTYSKLDSQWLGTELGKSIVHEIDKMKAVSIGSVVPNFKFKTADYKEHELYDYIKPSKHVLLIFTFKGCGGCKAQIPIVREIENKLKPNIQVIYVSIDKTEQLWKEDMSSGYTGILTLNLPPYNYSKDLESMFMVTFAPQLFLIDENYKIAYDNLSPYEDDYLGDLKKLLGVN